MAKIETPNDVLHDMRGFLECWDLWTHPGSPVRIASRRWFEDFVSRLAKSLEAAETTVSRRSIKIPLENNLGDLCHED